MQKHFPDISHQNGIKPLKTLLIIWKTPVFPWVLIENNLWKTCQKPYVLSLIVKIPEILIYFAFFSLQNAKNVL